MNGPALVVDGEAVAHVASMTYPAGAVCGDTTTMVPALTYVAEHRRDGGGALVLCRSCAMTVAAWSSWATRPGGVVVRVAPLAAALDDDGGA